MNIFILGCGRSGTSLVAGLFRNCGFYMGDCFYKNRESNPLGFFEDRTINAINEEILKPFLPDRINYSNIEYGSDIPLDGQRWLTRIPTETKITANNTIIKKIRDITSNNPFCIKDPRFCYTLDIWRNETPDAKFICVFRNPGDVVESILKEVRETPYLSNFSISVKEAFETWRLMYEHVLYKHSLTGDWLFLHFDDLFNSNTLERIEQFTGKTIDKDFPRTELKRSKSNLTLDNETQHLYNELLKMSI